MARTDDDSIAFLEEAEAGPPMVLMILVALMILGGVAGGAWYLIHGREAQEDGGGALIAAAPGPYKVKDTGANGMDIEGQGDAAFAASQGEEPQGQIDMNAAPETPIAVKRVDPKAPPAPVATITPATKPAPKPADAGPTLSGPGIVQLGSFDTREKAERAWSTMTSRFDYLKGLTHTVQTGEVIGRTVYRLRAGAGANAQSVCSQLKAASENCLVVG
jgi:cell division septation protein DedD